MCRERVRSLFGAAGDSDERRSAMGVGPSVTLLFQAFQAVSNGL